MIINPANTRKPSITAMPWVAEKTAKDVGMGAMVNEDRAIGLVKIVVEFSSYQAFRDDFFDVT